MTHSGPLVQICLSVAGFVETRDYLGGRVMLRGACLRLVIAGCSLLLASAANAERRVALVIGNSAYKHASPLPNPKNDAADMAAKLKKLGFEIVDGFDLDKAALDRKIRDFADKLSGADTGLFFYAGHGLQVGGVNYLVPIDAQLTTATALDFEMVRLDLVQRAMEREGKTSILFLDACRNNPLAKNLARAMGTRSVSIGRGLAVTESGAGTLISFSTQPDNVALDGSGRNSPYTASLVKHIGAPGESLVDVLTSVRRDVIEATDGRQVPWEHSALTDRLVFVPPDSSVIQTRLEVDQANNGINAAQMPATERKAAEVDVPKQQTKEAECTALAPSSTQDIKESFRGEIEGRLGGIVGKLTGGVAGLEGEYSKVVEDTLKGYPESHRLYVWQRLIYLACINKDSGIDLNALAQAYLTGPSLLGSRENFQDAEMEIELVGFDRVASVDTVGHYEMPEGINARLPDIVFLFNNVSSRAIHVALDECSFVNFRYPEPVPISSYGLRAQKKQILSITGTGLMFAVGSSVIKVPPGQKKYVSFGIGQVDPPSFEARQRGSSTCTFRVGDGTVLQPRNVEFTSPGRYISQR